jgi:hypothetical protein
MTGTLVFVDARVPNSFSILSGLPADAEWYLIYMSEDGMTCMQAVLSNFFGSTLSHSEYRSNYL